MPARFLLVWTVFIYVFFSVSDSKLPSYLLPMFPPLALLMGRQIADMKSRRLFWLTAPVLVVVAILLGIIPFAANMSADTPLQHEMYSAYSVWLLVAAAIWLVGTVAALWLLRRDNKMAAVIVLALSSLIASQLATSGYNTIAPERSSYILADAIRPLIKPDVPFYSVFCYEQTLPFYLKRTFTLVDFQDEMAFRHRDGTATLDTDGGSAGEALERADGSLCYRADAVASIFSKSKEWR